MIVVAAFESPAVVASLDNVAVVGQTVEQRSGHLGVAEHAGPFAEGEIGGDDDGRSLVEPADEVEQQLAAGLGERQVPYLAVGIIGFAVNLFPRVLRAILKASSMPLALG